VLSSSSLFGLLKELIGYPLNVLATKKPNDTQMTKRIKVDESLNKYSELKQINYLYPLKGFCSA
jgi:hypothetical protein